ERPARDLSDRLSSRTRLHLSEFTEGLDLRLRSWGSAQGNPAELAKRLGELRGLVYRPIVTGRGHGSLDRVREVVGPAPEAVEAPLANGFVFAPAKIAVATE